MLHWSHAANSVSSSSLPNLFQALHKATGSKVFAGTPYVPRQHQEIQMIRYHSAGSSLVCDVIHEEVLFSYCTVLPFLVQERV